MKNTPPRKCPRGACQRPPFGEAALCLHHLTQARERGRRCYRLKVGIPIEAPLKKTGRPREESLLAAQP